MSLVVINVKMNRMSLDVINKHKDRVSPHVVNIRTWTECLQLLST